MLFMAMTIVGWIALALAAWALIDCALRPSAAFPAADRQTKAAWLIFLSVAVVIQVIMDPISLFGIAAIVVSVFYLVDVRSKVVAMSRS